MAILFLAPFEVLPQMIYKFFFPCQGNTFEVLSEEEVKKRKEAAEEKKKIKFEKQNKRKEKKKQQAGKKSGRKNIFLR